MFKKVLLSIFLMGLVGCGDRITQYKEVLVPAPEVNMVQLCDGDTGEFVEYGILIDSTLYAVFHRENSDGTSDTFLAEIPSGTYKTTNGSDCIFIID